MEISSGRRLLVRGTTKHRLGWFYRRQKRSRKGRGEKITWLVSYYWYLLEEVPKNFLGYIACLRVGAQLGMVVVHTDSLARGRGMVVNFWAKCSSDESMAYLTLTNHDF